MDGEIQSDWASPPSLGSPGAALAAARVAQGLTVEHVADRLKLTAFQIKAIEEDNFGVLPGAVFARGFVRNYARLLNLNIDPLLPAMAQQDSSVAPGADARLLRDVKGAVLGPVRFRGLPIAAAVIAGVVGVLVFYEFKLNEPRTPKPMVAEIPSVPVPVPVAPAATDGLPVQAAPAVEPVASLGAEEVQKPASDEKVASRGLHFLFSRESWVEVRDGTGSILFSQTNLPGTEQSVRGQPPFSVIVGNARGVQLAYNGNRVDLAAYATEDVARLRLE